MLTGDKPRVAVIRTSDRSNFRKCRRAWAFQSHMRMNREPKKAAKPLVFGTGIYYAMEDMYNEDKRIFDSPVDALQAYKKALERQSRQEMPDEWEEEMEMGYSMMDYYKNCLLYTSPSPRDRQKSRMPSSA